MKRLDSALLQAAENDDVPWAVRYVVPIAGLALVALVLTVAWLLIL